MADNRLNGDGNWHGYLTRNNARQVQARLLRLLRGQFFTMVATNSGFQHRPPDVRAGQWLHGEEGVTLNLALDPKGVQLCVHDSYGVHGVFTDAPDIASARQRAAMSEEPDTDLVYLTFEYSRVTIRHYAPGGNVLLWIFQVEDHLPELHSLADCAAIATTLARHLEELTETMPVIARWPSQSGDTENRKAIAAAATRIARALVTLPYEADSKKENNDEH